MRSSGWCEAPERLRWCLANQTRWNPRSSACSTLSNVSASASFSVVPGATVPSSTIDSFNAFPSQAFGVELTRRYRRIRACQSKTAVINYWKALTGCAPERVLGRRRRHRERVSMSHAPTTREIGIIMNGVSGRMGYRQHLMRSILAIRDEGGFTLPDGTKLTVRPLLVGRSEHKLAEVAKAHDIPDYTTDLDAALADPAWEIYGDFLVTKARVAALRKAIAAGKAIYTEKPTAETTAEAVELAKLADEAGIKTGVVHDKLYLPGLLKLRRLIDSGFFGEILSVRGEFGYWVFEGDWQPAQRPSWNYRSEDGGGIIVDMFPHWNYILENLFGKVNSVYAHASTHITTRWDEADEPYTATADDAAYGIFELDSVIIAQINSSWTTRVNRDDLVEFHVDGTLGSAVVGLFGARVQRRSATPKPVWNPDVPDAHDYDADWLEVTTNPVFLNGFRHQWQEFLTAYHPGEPYPFDMLAGARGVQLAEAGLESSRDGKKIVLDDLGK